MRLLLDANLSPALVGVLADGGQVATHVADVALQQASDEDIADFAVEDRSVIVTADSDFPMILALRRAQVPSVILLRNVSELGPDAHATLLLANLPTVSVYLEEGAIVSLSPTRLAVRTLPIT